MSRCPLFYVFAHNYIGFRAFNESLIMRQYLTGTATAKPWTSPGTEATADLPDNKTLTSELQNYTYGQRNE